MKKVFSISKRFFLITSTVALGALILSSCGKENNDTRANSNMYTVSGNASGSQMVPAVSGNGSATLTGTFNSNTRLLTYTTNWTGLSGAPTSGGFYAGASGTNGTLIDSTWHLGTGLSSAGTFSSQVTLTPDQATMLRNGNLYYTIGTAANTSGEIRGQLSATPM